MRSPLLGKLMLVLAGDGAPDVWAADHRGLDLLSQHAVDVWGGGLELGEAVVDEGIVLCVRLIEPVDVGLVEPALLTRAPRGTLTRIQNGWFMPASRSRAFSSGGRGSGQYPPAALLSVGCVTLTYRTSRMSTLRAARVAPEGAVRTSGVRVRPFIAALGRMTNWAASASFLTARMTIASPLVRGRLPLAADLPTRRRPPQTDLFARSRQQLAIGDLDMSTGLAARGNTTRKDGHTERRCPHWRVLNGVKEAMNVAVIV